MDSAKVELRRILKQHILSGLPLPAETSALLDSVSPDVLSDCFAAYELHDLVRYPVWGGVALTNQKVIEEQIRIAEEAGDVHHIKYLRGLLCGTLAAHERRMNANGKPKPTRLYRQFSRKMLKGNAQPSCHRVLHNLRAVFSVFIQKLPERQQLQLRHMFSVNQIPEPPLPDNSTFQPSVWEELLRRRLEAVTFSTSRRSCELESKPVRLSKPRVQSLCWQRNLEGKIIPIFTEGRFDVSPTTLKLQLVDDFECRFDLMPRLRGAERYGSMPVTKTVSLYNALACHEAAEMVVVNKLGVPDTMFGPQVYVGMNRPDEFTPEGEDNLSQAVCEDATIKLNLWLDHRGNAEDIRKLLPATPSETVNPFEWLDYLATPEVNSRLIIKTNWDGYLEQLGDEFAWHFLVAVWRSNRIDTGTARWLIPLNYFSPGTPQDPVRQAADRLYVQFSDYRFFGREVYKNGQLFYDPRLPAVQVWQTPEDE